MPIYCVAGHNRTGAPFSCRLEAGSEAELRLFCRRRGWRVDAICPVPLSAWPTARQGWAILALPLCCAVVAWSIAGAVEAGQGGHWHQLAAALAGLALSAYLVHNILWRLGRHYWHEGGRVVEIRRGPPVDGADGGQTRH